MDRIFYLYVRWWVKFTYMCGGGLNLLICAVVGVGGGGGQVKCPKGESVK